MDENEVVLTNAPATGTVDPLSKVGLELPDDDPVVKALNLKREDGQPEAEQKSGENHTEPQIEVSPTEPQSQEPPKDEGTVTPEAKPDKVPYTEDELKALLADPNATLDTSRLDERGQAIHKEFQRGYTKKFEELKRVREEVEKRQREIAEFEDRQRQIVEQQRFQKEAEEFGEDEAKRLQREREKDMRLANLENALKEMQWKEASNAYRVAFNDIAPRYNIPITQEFENLVMADVWANNQNNLIRGQEPIMVEDAAKRLADHLGFTNPNNLERIINANPKNKEAYDNKVIADYLKKKATGANVPSPNSATTTEKTSIQDTPVDMEAFSKDPGAALYDRVMKRLEENNLKVK